MWRALLLLALMLPDLAQAGPWLRAEGEKFLSFSLLLEDVDESGSANGYASLYGEYGATPNLTLGVDIGTNEDGVFNAFAFALLPISQDRIKIAFEIGAGLVERAGTLRSDLSNGSFGAVTSALAVRPGLSIGTGFSAMGTEGWFAIDTRGEIMVEDGDAALASDITLGLKPRARTKVILQLQQGGPMSDPDYMRFAPSVVWEVGPGRHLELGATAGLKNAEAYGIKLGFWRRF